MPEWLTHQNESLLSDKKDTFLIKNQKGLLFILEKFDASPEKNAATPIHPTLSFLSTIGLLLVMSLTQSLLVLWICGLYFMGMLLFMPPAKSRQILSKSVVLLIMPLFVYFPSLLLHQANLLFIIRLPFIAFVISHYTETTTSYQLLGLLKRWHLPNIVLFQLDITIKYIYLLAKVLLNMVKGIRARHVGNHHLKMYLGTNLIALVYLRSLDYGKKLQQAMEARGFDGTYHSQKIPFKKTDYWYILLQAALFLVIFLIGRI
ncbi:cobalt permease [Enterococcus saigonensis]|uniref:Cobalt permease n=1 Tax=Enterococcus saigonensis TaxID=1805431 RepID=A0A679IN80_9ENTE|nr:energy-coupling factor transporter transmembrane component T [Enterococcus saigonensis]BCA87035.1 cobalt permease [Enterococcus saigonensis]